MPGSRGRILLLGGSILTLTLAASGFNGMAGQAIAVDLPASTPQVDLGGRNGGSVSLSFEATVTGFDAGITAFQVGDRFSVNLTLNDLVQYTNGSEGAGTFPGLVTSYSVTANPANAGTWTPGGSPNLPGSNYTTNALGDNFTFELVGTGFPNGGPGLVFGDFDLYFHWLPGVTDNGLNDTLAEQLGVPFGVPPGLLLFRILFTDGEDFPEVRFATSKDPLQFFKAEELELSRASQLRTLVSDLLPRLQVDSGRA